MSNRLRDRDADDLNALESQLPEFVKDVNVFAPTGASVVIYTFTGVRRGGIGLIRHSAKEDPKKEGSTSIAQYKPIRETCERHELSLTHLVVTFDNSGDHYWEHRPDLLLVHQQLRTTGLPPFLIFSRDSRFSRRVSVAEAMLDLLRATGLQLWLADMGRPIDPDSDELIVIIKTGVAAQDRRDIRRRTGAGRITAWEAGRLTSRPPIGFDSDDGVPIYDPVGFAVVREVFELADDPGPGSKLTEIARVMAARGHDLSESKIRDILREEAYVTGVLTRTDHETGQTYHLRRVDLPNPIPAEVRRTALRYLARRSSGSQRDVDAHPLRRLLIEHAACRNSQDNRGRPHILQSRVRPGRNSYGDEVIMHRLNPGTTDCEGLYLDAELVERHLSLALLSAARSLPHHDKASTREEEDLYRREAELTQRLDTLVAEFDLDNRGDGIEIIRSAARVLQDLRRQIGTLAMDPILTASSHYLATRENLLLAAREILLDPDPGPDVRQLRVLMIERVVARLNIYTGEGGEITNLHIFGKSPGDGVTDNPRQAPLAAWADLLVEHLESIARSDLDAGEGMVRTASQGSPKAPVRNMRKTNADVARENAFAAAGPADYPWTAWYAIAVNTVDIRTSPTSLREGWAQIWTMQIDLPDLMEEYFDEDV